MIILAGCVVGLKDGTVGLDGMEGGDTNCNDRMVGGEIRYKSGAGIGRCWRKSKKHQKALGQGGGEGEGGRVYRRETLRKGG